MNWHQMIPAWFRRAEGGKIPPPTETKSIPVLLSPGRQLPTVVVVSPLYRHASLYVQWKRERPETDPLTVFRLISNADRLRGMRGDGVEFVYVEASGFYTPYVDKLLEYLAYARRCENGAAAPLTFVDLDEIYGVRRDG